MVKLLRIGPAGAPFRNLRYLEALGLSISIEQGEIETLRWQIEQGFPPITFVNTKIKVCYTAPAPIEMELFL